MKRNFLTAAIGALMIAAGIGEGKATQVSPRRDNPEAYAYRPTRYSRSRLKGKHNPAGTKLARMAAEGRLGIANLR